MRKNNSVHLQLRYSKYCKMARDLNYKIIPYYKFTNEIYKVIKEEHKVYIRERKRFNKLADKTMDIGRKNIEKLLENKDLYDALEERFSYLFK